MQHEQMREAGARGVQEQFIPRLFDALAERHTRNKKVYLECPCSFCSLKRDATYYIGTATYPPGYDGYRPLNYSGYTYDMESFIDTKRHYIRDWFRKQLKETRDE